MNLLEPSLRDFSYLDCRRRAELIGAEARNVTAGAVMIDVGGRGKPYAKLFEGRLSRHFVLDVETGQGVDVVADARQLPFADGSVGAVLCTQVLEHIPEPVKVTCEIHRVLRPDGLLLLAVPAIFPQHGSPGDYWRFTPQGLEWMLRRFGRVDISAEAGTFASFFLVFNMYLFLFSSWSPPLRRLIAWTLCPVNNVLGLLLGSLRRGKQFASNFFVVAVR